MRRTREDGIYCTSYCNHGHRLSDGWPVGHGCYVIPPKALELERAGDTDGALAVLTEEWLVRVQVKGMVE